MAIVKVAFYSKLPPVPAAQRSCFIYSWLVFHSYPLELPVNGKTVGIFIIRLVTCILLSGRWNMEHDLIFAEGDKGNKATLSAVM